MNMWTIEFINESAEEEVMALSASLKSRFLHVSEQIIKFGPANVGMPHVKYLENKLWEIRLKSKDGIARSIYVVVREKRIIILHTFIKKTQKTPQKALKKARERLKEVQND